MSGSALTGAAMPDSIMADAARAEAAAARLVLSSAASHAPVERARSLAVPAAWCLVLAVLMLPLLLFERPHLQDFANHLSRVEITLAMADPAIARNYEPVPLRPGNAAFDVVVRALAPVMPLEAGARLFVIVSLLLMASGALALRLALGGRWDAVALASLPFLYSGSFSYGFLPYLFGVGVALHAMALWTWAGSRHWALRLALAPLPMLLVSIHIYALAIFALFAAAETWQRLDGAAAWRSPAFWLKAVRDGMVGLPALILLAGFGEGGTTIGSGRLEWTLAKPIFPIWVLGYGPWWTTLMSAAAWLSAVWPAVRARAWTIDPRAKAAALAMFAAFLVLPTRLGELYSVDWRILTPALLVALAGLRVDPAVAEAGRRRVLLAIPALAAAMAASLCWLWLPAEAARREVLAITEGLPPGSRLFWGISDPPTSLWVASSAYGIYHAASHAAATRRILVSSTFAIPGQHPLRLRDPALRGLRHLSHVDLHEARKLFAEDGLRVPDIAALFDHILLYGPAGPDEAALLPLDRMRLVRTLGLFRLYKLEPAGRG